MPRGQAGTLSDQRGADKSSGQAESGGVHGHRRHTLGVITQLWPQLQAGMWAPVTRFPALSKKAKNPDFFNVTFLSYFNLVWPNKILTFLGPDTALG